MREIKFRVWDKDNSAYKLIHKDNICGEINNLSWLILEQYTGLKDKNGVEIYEGDLMKICATGNMIDAIEVCVFVNSDGAFLTRHQGVHVHSVFHITKHFKYFEVIGNIH